MTVALVLGGAGSVWQDFTAATELGRFDGVVACNDMGVAWPGRLDGWVSLHAPKYRVWGAQRRARGLPDHKATFAHLDPSIRDISPGVDHFVDHAFPGQVHSGSSGLFALKVALIDLGFDRAVLCGVPMLATPGHFFDASPWTGAAAHRIGWSEALHHIKDRARSMSGWTSELLGQPTAEWVSCRS